jgi:hypothetical protein
LVLDMIFSILKLKNAIKQNVSYKKDMINNFINYKIILFILVYNDLANKTHFSVRVLKFKRIRVGFRDH